MNRYDWKAWLLVLLALPVATIAVQMLGRGVAERADEKEHIAARSSVANPEVKVIVSTQSTDGVTQEQFDRQFLKNLEEYSVSKIKEKTKESLAAHGYPNAEIELEVGSVYVFSGPYKLAVIRLKVGPSGSQVLIAGILGNEFMRIACMSEADSIPVSYGACGDKIAEVFGHRIGE